MSDAEHELIVDNQELIVDNGELQQQLDRVSVIALRALAAASEAQDAAFGHHEPWLDDAKPFLAKGPTGVAVRTLVRLAMDWKD